jgi:hypothetical protein
MARRISTAAGAGLSKQGIFCSAALAIIPKLAKLYACMGIA